MSDIPTYCCDRPECQATVEITALVKIGREYWCRCCYERLHPPTPAGRSTRRIEGNRLARSDTRFGDWPGPTGGVD